MVTTRKALANLVDESKPIETRMGPATAIKGMGKGIITAILHVAYPDRYGVWNSTSEAGLVKLGLMPVFERGASFGERYAAINDVFQSLVERLDVDLWTLDALWANLGSTGDEAATDPEISSDEPLRPNASSGKRAFALERHLHDYLFDNWENLSLASE